MQQSLITEEMVRQAQAFHGHMCPGLAIGIRAAEVALGDIGPHAEDDWLHLRQGQLNSPGLRQERFHLLPAFRWQGGPHCHQARNDGFPGS